MSRTFTVACGIAAMVFMLAPGRTHAQSLTESVSKLSSGEITRIVKAAPPPAHPAAQPSPRPRTKSIHTKVISGLVIGAIAGVSAGFLLSLSCPGEHSSGCLAYPVGFGAAGAGIGAAIGAAR